jgi:Ran GTPase-activating protein (RanGAP) involved in mRNA processing and transport
MSLENLNMNRNSIADEGACALGLATQKQCTLRELHVSSNCIKERGSLAIAVALKCVQSMQLVDLRGNKSKFSYTKIEYMLQQCSRNVQCFY